MRNDMAQVIVERPRIPDHTGRKGRSIPLDELPHHEGMRRPHLLHGDGKSLNENLRPLRRHLERQVGRPWNKVYAEIAANLRVDNTVQQHVRDHLRDFVAVAPRRINNGWRYSLGGALWWQPLYVDPVTGFLCRTDRLPEEKARRRRAKQPRPRPIERIALAPDRELRRIVGLWYELTLAPLPEPSYRTCPELQARRLKPWDRRSPEIEIAVTVRRLVTPAVRDMATKQLIEVGPPIDEPGAWQSYRRIVPDRRYAIAKRALSNRDLRRHGLINAGPEEGGQDKGATSPASRSVAFNNARGRALEIGAIGVSAAPAA